MKKKRIRAINQVADLLPDSFIIRPHTETGPLSEWYRFKESGQEEAEHLPELPPLTEENKDELFSWKYPAVEKLNHSRRLRKAYKDKGTEGVKEYILWVKAHNERMMKDNEAIKPVDDRLVAIARKHVSSFWGALITFLVSFAAMFGVKKEEVSQN